MTPAQRSLRARIAAHSKWAQQDRVAGTSAARRAFNDRFERLVDPDQALDEAERRRRADSARKAHFAQLALASASARRGRGRA